MPYDAHDPRTPVPGGGSDEPVPGTPAWDAQFGRGWTAIVVAALAAFLLGFVALFFAESPAAKVRALAYVVAVFAAMFVVAPVYLTANGVGLPWSVSLGRWGREGVLHPRRNPVAFPVVMALFVAAALAALGAAGYAWTHAQSVGAYLESHGGDGRGGR